MRLVYDLAENWEAALEVGGADLHTDLRLLTRDFEDDGLRPFGTIGIKGLLYRGDAWSSGAFLQASLFSGYEDKDYGVSGFLILDSIVLGSQDVVQVQSKDHREIATGVSFQTRVGRSLLYRGPLAYPVRAERVVEYGPLAGRSTR